VVVHIEAEDAAGEERLSRVYEDLSALSAMELFGELEYPELLEVASALRTEELEKDVTVLTEGEASKALYVIAAGKVSVEKGGSQLTTLASGSHFGEMALLTNRPRTATVKTLEPTRLLILDQDAVYPLFQTNPVIGVKFLWRLGQVQSLRLDEATLLLRPPSSGSDGLDFSGERTQRLFPPPFSKRRPED
jgi:CRP-like cAMP-binding protein